MDNRQQADWLTRSGYLALAPDLYPNGHRPACLRAVYRDLVARAGPSFEIIEAARRRLVDRSDCSGAVGVLGFCMGDGFGLLCARGRRFGASSVNYGMVLEDAASLLRGACPVIGSFGASDFLMRDAADRLDRALTKASVNGEVKAYPAVGHAFLSDHGCVIGWVMARIGMTPYPIAAADAQARILRFFYEHLGDHAEY